MRKEWASFCCMTELCAIIQGACDVYVELGLVGLNSEAFMVRLFFLEYHELELTAN
jgi:hypothetical protein